MKTLKTLGGQQYAPWDVVDNDVSARSIKSAERTLALFELFSLHQTALPVGEISKALGIPQPSVTMLVRNLVKMGYLEHDRATRSYIPTIRIMLLGSWVHRLTSPQIDIDKLLDNLLNAVGETVVVGIQNGIYSQYVSAQMPDAPNRMEVQSGMLRPIPRTAIGRALLSQKSDAEIALIVRRYNAEVESDARYNLSDFMEIIDRVRNEGYAQTWGDMTSGFSAIAVALPAPVGKIPIAVGVGGPLERTSQKKDAIVEALGEFSAAFRRAQ